VDAALDLVTGDGFQSKGAERLVAAVREDATRRCRLEKSRRRA
jgi:hypothetical protein